MRAAALNDAVEVKHAGLGSWIGLRHTKPPIEGWGAGWVKEPKRDPASTGQRFGFANGWNAALPTARRAQGPARLETSARHLPAAPLQQWCCGRCLGPYATHQCPSESRKPWRLAACAKASRVQSAQGLCVSFGAAQRRRRWAELTPAGCC